MTEKRLQIILVFEFCSLKPTVARFSIGFPRKKIQQQKHVKCLALKVKTNENKRTKTNEMLLSLHQHINFNGRPY